MLSWPASISLQPLASAPLFITILSIPILKEPVGVRRWLAVVGGFIAILFMMQPGSGLVPLASGLLVCSNIFYSVSVILSRIVGRHDGAGITPTTRLRPPGLLELEELLAEHLETRVNVRMGAKRGRIAIDFADLEDLERIYRRMTGE